jgi:hypothetical protein
MDNLYFFDVNSSALEGFKEITTRTRGSINLQIKKIKKFIKGIERINNNNNKAQKNQKPALSGFFIACFSSQATAIFIHFARLQLQTL